MQIDETPYDRHLYKIVYSNGTNQAFDNYYDMMQSWVGSKKEDLSHVEILDKKTKQKKTKGFL